MPAIQGGYEIERRHPDKAQYRQQIARLVDDRFQSSYNAHERVFARTARRYDMYRGHYQGVYHTHRNNVSIPLLFSIIQSDVAHKVQTLFSVYPIVEMEGYGPEDAGVARKNTVLISAQMKDCDSFRKAVDFFTSADIYGTAIYQTGWRYEQSERQFREQIVDDYVGTYSEYDRTQTVVDFDGPNWEVVDILDFFPQPGKKRVEEMDWVIRRMWMDYDLLRQLAAEGVYDRARVEDLKHGTAEGVTGLSGYMDRITTFRNYVEEEARSGGADKSSRPVEIFEMWGELPDELLPPDGIKSRVITIANGHVVLRNRPNPYWHGKIPFGSYCPIPDPHFFHGIGKLEVGERMQAAANRFLNQKLDALDLYVDPMFIYDRNRGINVRGLYSRAGGKIGVDGPVDDTAIRPLIPDLRGLTGADVEVEQLWRWIQQSTGQPEDTMMGGTGVTKRQTAHEFVGRRESVGVRSLLEARLAEEAFIEPIGNMFRVLNRQFLSVPRELRILGDNARVNPITGEQLPPENTVVTLEDLYPDYDVRAKGATQLMSRDTMKMNLQGLLQSISANPAAGIHVNWVALLRQTFRLFEFTNVDELLNAPDNMKQLNALMLGVGQGQDPGESQRAIAGMIAPGVAE